MTTKSTLIWILIAQLLGAAPTGAQPAKVAGTWKVEIAFNSGPARILRLEAEDSGKGSFLLLDPTLKAWGPAKPAQVKWSQSDDGSVTFSGPVEFPLGNVGRDVGTLILKGKFQGDDTITGKATLLPLDQDQKDADQKPAREGSFKASRGGA